LELTALSKSLLFVAGKFRESSASLRLAAAPQLNCNHVSSTTVSPKKTKLSTSKPDRVGEILDYLHIGFKDYVAARTLLRAGLPIQGSGTASTAVEKYIKALLALRGNRAHGHLRSAHTNALRHMLPETWAQLNPSFLTFLQRCYTLRYADNIKPGFNLVAFSREVLAELDHTILLLAKPFRFTRPSGEVIQTAMDRAIQLRAPVLFDDNHVLLGQDKRSFLSIEDKACAIRHRGVEGLLEAEFIALSSPTDGNFTREALVPKNTADLLAASEPAAS